MNSFLTTILSIAVIAVVVVTMYFEKLVLKYFTTLGISRK